MMISAPPSTSAAEATRPKRMTVSIGSRFPVRNAQVFLRLLVGLLNIVHLEHLLILRDRKIPLSLDIVDHSDPKICERHETRELPDIERAGKFIRAVQIRQCLIIPAELHLIETEVVVRLALGGHV